MTTKEVITKTDDMFNQIFKNYQIDTLSDIVKTKIIYNYLVNVMDYDYVKLSEREQRINVDLLSEVGDVLLYKKGICSALSQVYKLLLEKAKINVKTVICDDSNKVLHQLNLVFDKESGFWFFSDVTRGIIEKTADNIDFCYGSERAASINQKMLGILPEEVYDYVLDKNDSNAKTDYHNLNQYRLFDISENIISDVKMNLK